MVKELRALGADVREEFRCEASGYSIDALVEFDGKRVALEVDGPSHFVGRSQQPTGATLLKQRQLRHLDWQLASVPYWEWDQQRQRDGRKQYLRARLDEAGDFICS